MFLEKVVIETSGLFAFLLGLFGAVVGLDSEVNVRIGVGIERITKAARTDL